MKAIPAKENGQNFPRGIVSPSILSADFANLQAECNRMLDLGADWLHVDVMDGHFVPNLTLGAPIVTSLRKATPGFLDCHLMVSNPGQWVDDFAKAGADMYTFHLESLVPQEAWTDPAGHPAVFALIDRVHALKMHCGIAIKPKTPAESLYPYLDKIQMALVMTVEPGFGGQKFMADMMGKVKALRERSAGLNIQVDGGLAPDTIEQAAAAGANVIVAGSAVFGAKEPGAVIQQLRDAVNRHAAAA